MQKIIIFLFEVCILLPTLLSGDRASLPPPPNSSYKHAMFTIIVFQLYAVQISKDQET